MNRLDYIERCSKAVSSAEQHLEQVLALGLKELPCPIANYATELYDKLEPFISQMSVVLESEKARVLDQEFLAEWELKYVNGDTD